VSAPASLPVAPQWFAWRPLGHGVTVFTEPYVAGLLRANLYLVEGTERDLLVDTGNGVGALGAALRAAGGAQRRPQRPLVVVVTHAHIDHAGGAAEFGTVLVHGGDAPALRAPFPGLALVTTGWDAKLRADLVAAGIAVPDLLVRALPREDFDPWSYRVRGVEPAALLEDGQVLDLGDRVLRVLHLPGHTPGSVGLIEERSGLLFTGDALYDGGLIDTLPESDVAAYCATMRRLRELPVACVLPGHGDVFGRARLLTLTAAYLRRRG